MTLLNHVSKHVEYLARKGRTLLTNDLRFHQMRLEKVSGRPGNIRQPVTLSEKICHRLVFDRNPLFTLLADKLNVRHYVHANTALVNTVPLLGVYRQVKEINFATLPDQFVLKCNHDSGSTQICTDKRTFDATNALRRLHFASKRNMYYTTREWQYKNIVPMILCEQYIAPPRLAATRALPEMLRLHCFHGILRVIEADFTDSHGREFINVYDRDWQPLPCQMEYPNTPHPVPAPALLGKAIIASQQLAHSLDYCRVDLMLHDEGIYFSEITLSPRRGKLTITPMEWDTQLGNLWQWRAETAHPHESAQLGYAIKPASSA
ncbi:glycosyl transferase [Pantoea sp. Mb-10]|uniref:ATP-grasp fold amidoligase family protein n=1 Tax=unclassified Pantoea TaxID=2630326 RepID=UPI001E525B43|nr:MULTISPECIES: ATP-grasp fold amidoligase family protein [unclassified Pantoea]MCE0490895.1 glycosyl transferase [Pantoea sp. Mb-10]MCE0499947.1 glycosyl transferase [Pantoea sp. Pb-8]